MRFIVLCLTISVSASLAQRMEHPGSPREQGFIPPTQVTISRPLVPSSLTSTLNPQAAVANVKPLEMKLLILSTDGAEPELTALKTFLDYQGTPYEVVRLALGENLPPLEDGNRGFYQGVVLTTGNLGVCDPACRSALSPAGWTTLETYARDYAVRIASYYTYPEPRFGLMYTSGITPVSGVSLSARLTTAGAGIFPYLKPEAVIPIANAFVYLSKASPVTGEETVPLLMVGDGIVAATHKKADGREYMAFTADNNSSLFHSQALTYGMIRWITRGVFLGFRKAFLSPHVDDFFLPSVLFDGNKEQCRPGGTPFDPLNPAPPVCSVVRLVPGDFGALQDWQSSWREKPQFAGFKTTLVFNGYGTRVEDDALRLKALPAQKDFFWVNHTYDHRNLDCFSTVGGSCRAVNFDEAMTEIGDNFAFAAKQGLAADPLSVVTPMITGLTSPDFLRATAQSGVRYLVADGSRAEGTPAIPNTPIPSATEESVLLIPRRPTNIFFESATGDEGTDGSEVDEFNFLYGPNGFFRIGGAGGKPFFTNSQKYNQIIDRESDQLMGYLFRGDMYPLMFHQSNLYRYLGLHTIYSDLFDSIFSKWSKISNLPVSSLSQSAIGAMLEERKTYLNAKVKGVWTPGLGVKIDSSGAAKVPVTGVCAAGGCESYGSDKISFVAVEAASITSIDFQ